MYSRVIRFEDLAMNPMETFEEMFNFIGVEMVDTVREQIRIRVEQDQGITVSLRVMEDTYV